MSRIKLDKITGPTYMTIARMILAVIFMIFVLQPDFWARIVALIVFIAAAATDKIDGNWARKTNTVTDLGAFLDPLADKMLVNLAFLALTYIGVVPIAVLAIILVRDFAVDGIRMMVARNGVTLSASFLGKLKTTFQMITLIILLFNLIANLEFFTIIGNIALYFSLFLTILSGAVYIIQGFNSLDSSKKPKPKSQ